MDGLQGHLSSFDFLPAWTRTWHRRNIFTDPDVVAGQAEYLRTLAAALADRPNFIGMTLGNEVNQFAGGPHPDPDRITPTRPGSWLRRLLAACEEGAPGRLHLHAEYDAAWYQDDHPFTPAHAARIGAATAVHSWVFNGTAQRHGRTGVATEHHAAYLIELSKAWAARPAPAGVAPGGRRTRAARPGRARGRLHRGDRGERAGLPGPVGRHLVVLPRRVPRARRLPRTRVQPRPVDQRPAAQTGRRAIARIVEEWRGKRTPSRAAHHRARRRHR